MFGSILFVMKRCETGGFLLIGIILLDTRFPRILGDIGNPETFAYPVVYEKVEGAIPSRVVRDRDPALIEPFIQAARTLEKRGAKAITTSCGFLALWQQELASAVNVPVFTSSLIQVPWAYQLAGMRGRVGILTADASSLSESHLRGVGIDGVPVRIRGMAPDGEFNRVYLGNQPDLDVSKAEKEMVDEVSALILDRDVFSVVLECTNMPAFGKAVRMAAGVPVFDILTLVNYVWTAVVKP